MRADFFYILSDHENHFPAMTKDKNFHVIVLFLSIFKKLYLKVLIVKWSQPKELGHYGLK